MPWTETPSLSFNARHEDGDEPFAERTLDALEELRIKLEDDFETAPGGVTVVIHPTTAWLSLAHPYLPMARFAASPASRRYLAGWAMSHELHVLNDDATARIAAGEESLEALQRTAERLYAQLVVAANDPKLPPPWGPRRFAHYLRHAWLIEGAAQCFSGQLGLYRPAAAARLRDGKTPAFPPSSRDAITLGGTVFDLIAEKVGQQACRTFIETLRRSEIAPSLESIFETDIATIESAWRTHLSERVSRSDRAEGLAP